MNFEVQGIAPVVIIFVTTQGVKRAAKVDP
jgi:hypothetical protein